MKSILILMSFVFIFSQSMLFAGAEPTALELLDFLAYGGVGQMKYQLGGKPGGERPNLDDSDWEFAAVGFRWDTPESNVWFRSSINLTWKMGGFSLAGRRAKLYIGVDNGGIVFVNGDSIGAFSWGNGEFIISPKMKAGENLAIAVLGINHPGYGQLLDARIEFGGLEEFQQRLQPYVWHLFAAKKLARALSDQPEFWDTEVEKVAARALESPAFKSGNQDEFIATLQREAEALRPLGDEMRAKHHIYAAGYAHIDLAWLWTWRETVAVTRATTQSVFNIMKQFEDFKYTMGQAAAYHWLETSYPALFEQVKQKVVEGSWEIMGGMWVEPDCNLPSGESFVRQVLYGKRYFLDKFGVDVKVCWIPDSFGFNWNLPQILVRSGFDAFVTHKINWNDTNKFPYRFFWWQSPDGSRIMCYIPRSGYGHDLNGDDLIQYAAEERSELNLGKELVLYGVGNHGGGPTMKMLERAKTQISAPAYVDVKLAKSTEFFDSLTDAEKGKLPTWKSELYLEYHRGTYTSQANTKRHNRTLEGLALTTEKAATLAHFYGANYPKPDVDHIWRSLLFNQFHDILPGSSINPVYHDTELEYGRAAALSADILQHSLKNLAAQMDTRGSGEALVLFNPSTWPRTSLAVIELGRLEKTKKWTVKNAAGKVIPSQVVDENELGAKLIFVAENLPALGYQVFRLEEKPAADVPTELVAQKFSLKNAFLSLEVDPQTGLIYQLTDLANNWDVLAAPKGNLLQLCQVENLRDDAWNLRYVGDWIDLDSATVVGLVEAGPVRATIHVKHDFLGPQKAQRSPTENFPSSFFDQYISLYAGLPFVEVRNHFEWWEENKMLKVAFPVNVQADSATYEIPYGSIRRSTGNTTSLEKAQFEMPAQRWADLSDGQRGVSFINASKYGYDIKGNLMRLSLLRAPLDPDPMCDRGYHDFKYAIYPHAGDWRQAQTTRLGIEYNEPLVVQRTTSHKGSLPPAMSFLQVSPENVVLNVVKKAEDSNAWILRLYETAGRQSQTTVSFFQNIKSVAEVDLIEKAEQPVPARKNRFQFTIQPHEIRSFKIQF